MPHGVDKKREKYCPELAAKGNAMLKNILQYFLGAAIIAEKKLKGDYYGKQICRNKDRSKPQSGFCR